MYDYKLIEAIGVVISEGGFERAAQHLGITQSAVSQRVRLLEDQIGQVLLIRSSPPVLTNAGKIVMKHYQQVANLEQGIDQALRLARHQYARLSIGINDDSLATWFLGAVMPFLEQEAITLDLRVDDQDQTLTLLKTGEVMACLSSHDKPVQGCTINRLGTMNYRLAASSSFYKQWFAEGIDAEVLQKAPAVIFNRKDTLHHKAIGQHFASMPATFPCHYIPSSEQFVEFICQGFAYGAVPDLRGRDKIATGELIELFPDSAYPLNLYWHCWSQRSELVERFTAHLLRSASTILY